MAVDAPMSHDAAPARQTDAEPVPGSRTGRDRWPVVVSWALAGVLVPAALYGLLAADPYRGASAQLALGSRAQDVLTLALLPLLVWTGHRSRAGSLRGHLLWLGLLFYLAYSYAIYLIGWQQNAAFVLYTTAVTLSTAALVDGLARIDATRAAPAFARIHGRGTGWFLIAVGIVFAALWLVDLVPLVTGAGQPRNVGPGGVAFAVYVLDFVVALPAVVATGVMLVRRHPAGPPLAGVVLIKIVTLFLVLWVGAAGQPVAGLVFAITADMLAGAVLLVVSLVVLGRASRRLGRPEQGWLRPPLWR
jgi:hypothetical protein